MVIFFLLIQLSYGIVAQRILWLMFLKERFSYAIIVNFEKGSAIRDDVFSKKCLIFQKALLNLGAKPLNMFSNVYELQSVMYSRAIDLFEIIRVEFIRIVASDDSIPMVEKKLYEFSKELDKIHIYRYDTDNILFFS